MNAIQKEFADKLEGEFYDLIIQRPDYIEKDEILNIISRKSAKDIIVYTLAQDEEELRLYKKVYRKTVAKVRKRYEFPEELSFKLDRYLIILEYLNGRYYTPEELGNKNPYVKSLENELIALVAGRPEKLDVDSILIYLKATSTKKELLDSITKDPEERACYEEIYYEALDNVERYYNTPSKNHNVKSQNVKNQDELKIPLPYKIILYSKIAEKFWKM